MSDKLKWDLQSLQSISKCSFLIYYHGSSVCFWNLCLRTYNVVSLKPITTIYGHFRSFFWYFWPILSILLVKYLSILCLLGPFLVHDWFTIGPLFVYFWTISGLFIVHFSLFLVHFSLVFEYFNWVVSVSDYLDHFCPNCVQVLKFPDFPCRSCVNSYFCTSTASNFSAKKCQRCSQYSQQFFLLIL